MHTQTNIKVFVLLKGIKTLPIINTRYHAYPQHHPFTRDTHPGPHPGTQDTQAGRETGHPPSTLGLPPATPIQPQAQTHMTPTPPYTPRIIPRIKPSNHDIDSQEPPIPPPGDTPAPGPRCLCTLSHPRKGSICTLRDNHPTAPRSTPPPTYPTPQTPHAAQTLHERSTHTTANRGHHPKRDKEPHAVLHEQGRPDRTATPDTPSLLAPPKLPAAIRRAIHREIIHVTPHLAWIPSRINELFSTNTRGKPS